jgi:hypothetical protein
MQGHLQLGQLDYHWPELQQEPIEFVVQLQVRELEEVVELLELELDLKLVMMVVLQQEQGLVQRLEQEPEQQGQEPEQLERELEQLELVLVQRQELVLVLQQGLGQVLVQLLEH